MTNFKALYMVDGDVILKEETNSFQRLNVLLDHWDDLALKHRVKPAIECTVVIGMEYKRKLKRYEVIRRFVIETKKRKG